MPDAARLERLARARLYLVCGARPNGRPLASFLRAALAGGVDVVQLRDKTLDDRGLLEAAATFRAAADAAGALFVLNDRPDLVAAAEADGVHVGQEDMPVAAARARIGDERILGLSTHAPDQGAAAPPEADYVSIGPVHATPTKPGRPPTGLEYVHWAAAHVDRPWFAIGGIDPGTIGAVLDAGATRVVVVRALTEARDPEGTARALRAAIVARDAEEARVGRA